MPRDDDAWKSPPPPAKTSPFSTPLHPAGPRLRCAPNAEDFAAVPPKYLPRRLARSASSDGPTFPESAASCHPQNAPCFARHIFCSPPPHRFRVRLLESLIPNERPFRSLSFGQERGEEIEREMWPEKRGPSPTLFFQHEDSANRGQAYCDPATLTRSPSVKTKLPQPALEQCPLLRPFPVPDPVGCP
jgi:hypothetical protein